MRMCIVSVLHFRMEFFLLKLFKIDSFYNGKYAVGSTQRMKTVQGPHLVTFQTRSIKNVLRKKTVMWPRRIWFLEGQLSPHEWLHPPSQCLSCQETEPKHFSFFHWQWAHSSGGKRHASLAKDQLCVLEWTLSAQIRTKASTFARFSPILTKYAAAGKKEPFVPESTANCDLTFQSWRCVFH